MKKYVFAFFVMVVNMAIIKAQQTGTVMFEFRMDTHRSIPQEREDLKKIIPQYNTSYYDLFFTPSESHYKPREEDDDFGTSKGGVNVRMRMPQNEVFMELTSKQRTLVQEFMGKRYIIEDTLKTIPWTFGNEKLEILGYKCNMAYYNDTVKNQEVTAWFTNEIMPFIGPDQYANLPGTVLAVDINNGEKTWIARKVRLGELKKNDVKKPTKGEKATQNEYRGIVEEQREKMKSNGGMIRLGG